MAKQILALSSSARNNVFPNGTRLRVPFGGRATQWTNDTGGFRAARLPANEDTVPVLQAALKELGFIEQETIHLDVTIPPAGGGTRAPSADDQMALEPGKAPVSGPSVQLVLYVDEAGGMSWHLPDGWPLTRAHSPKAVPSEGAFRGAGKSVFTIPSRTVAARRSLESGQASFRGLITSIGRKVLKVFVIPLAADLLANPLEKIVSAVERRHAQDLIRPVTSDNYDQKVTTSFQRWSSLAGKRALLIVHGLFSSTQGMLNLLPRAAMDGFLKKYEGRVIAYDHLTLSKDPDENARFFLTQLKQALPNKRVEFDILCHSRGGIVSRALVERGCKLVPDHNCDFKRVFFVATPNQGSPLGNPEHVVDMADVFTNLVTRLPDNIAAYVIEAVLAVIKLIAYAALKSLPGLAAMGTETYIKTVLNSNHPKSPAVYGAAAADYDPDPDSPHAFLAAALNAAVDRAFTIKGKEIGNDLVVPCEGVYAMNGNPLFPIANPLVYENSDHICHTDFFAQARTVGRINPFLEIVEPLTAKARPAAIRLSANGAP